MTNDDIPIDDPTTFNDVEHYLDGDFDLLPDDPDEDELNLDLDYDGYTGYTGYTGYEGYQGYDE